MCGSQQSTAYAARKTLTHSSLAFVSLFSSVSLCAHAGLLQAGHPAASTAVDSDSGDDENFDQYSDLDAFDTDEVEVSPDDEQALAAFMVSLSAALSPQRCHVGCHEQAELPRCAMVYTP